MAFYSLTEWLGGRLTAPMVGFGHFAAFCGETFVRCLRPPWRWRLILTQSFTIGLRAMPVASMTALFVGMVIVLQSGYQLQMFFNAKEYAAGAAANALTQIMIPIFTAFVVGARCAASIAAELGTMRVTEQIDAVEVLDVEPLGYLVVPRVIAATLMLPVITIYTDLLGLFGGWFMGVYGLNIPSQLYVTKTFDFLTYGDFLQGWVKTFFFGAAMGLGGCYFGYYARGGAEGVGQATTKAVVYTLIMLVLLEYILSSWLLYIIDMLSQRTFS